MSVGAIGNTKNIFINPQNNLQIAPSVQFGGTNKTDPVNFYNTNPVQNAGLKGAFTVNYNNGELSPVVADGIRGNVLPRLYA